mmetsp:Transcript_33466/g.76471  ORF Transcript_33466/g.76471 Transcript_33466/m.76471 type:complete len:256 (-) Transcript_33466:1602-2369(-)
MHRLGRDVERQVSDIRGLLNKLKSSDSNRLGDLLGVKDEVDRAFGRLARQIACFTHQVGGGAVARAAPGPTRNTSTMAAVVPMARPAPTTPVATGAANAHLACAAAPRATRNAETGAVADGADFLDLLAQFVDLVGQPSHLALVLAQAVAEILNLALLLANGLGGGHQGLVSFVELLGCLVGKALQRGVQHSDQLVDDVLRKGELCNEGVGLSVLVHESRHLKGGPKFQTKELGHCRLDIDLLVCQRNHCFPVSD